MSRKKTQNKTNIFLDDVSRRFDLKDDVALGSFFGVEKSTVSAWRVRDSIPKRYIRFLESKATPEKQNVFSVATGKDIGQNPATSYEDLKMQFSLLRDHINTLSAMLAGAIADRKADIDRIDARHLETVKRIDERLESQAENLHRKEDRLIELDHQLGVMQSALIQAEKQKDFLPLKILSGSE